MGDEDAEVLQVRRASMLQVLVREHDLGRTLCAHALRERIRAAARDAHAFVKGPEQDGALARVLIEPVEEEACPLVLRPLHIVCTAAGVSAWCRECQI